VVVRCRILDSTLIFVLQGDDLKAETTRVHLALPDPYVHEAPRSITGDEQSFEAYKTLRVARANARYDGVRKIRAAKVCCSQFV
jgi:large subunit ribosomal protein L13e